MDKPVPHDDLSQKTQQSEEIENQYQAVEEAPRRARRYIEAW